MSGKCDSCALLAVPENAELARYYRVCTWPAPPLPSNVLQQERGHIAELGSNHRWVTVGMITTRKELLHDCPCWQPRA